MREIRQSGSVRGVRRKPYPYRDEVHPTQSGVLLGRIAQQRCSNWRRQQGRPGKAGCVCSSYGSGSRTSHVSSGRRTAPATNERSFQGKLAAVSILSARSMPSSIPTQTAVTFESFRTWFQTGRHASVPNSIVPIHKESCCPLNPGQVRRPYLISPSE